MCPFLPCQEQSDKVCLAWQHLLPPAILWFPRRSLMIYPSWQPLDKNGEENLLQLPVQPPTKAR